MSSSKSRLLLHMDTVSFRYSLYHGLLKLPTHLRREYNIDQMLYRVSAFRYSIRCCLQIDGENDECFGNWKHRLFVKYLIGVDDLIMSSLRSLAENETDKGSRQFNRCSGLFRILERFDFRRTLSLCYGECFESELLLCSSDHDDICMLSTFDIVSFLSLDIRYLHASPLFTPSNILVYRRSSSNVWTEWTVGVPNRPAFNG